MAIAMTEEMSASFQRGLSEWWSEETEYIFQRIERWAALARGYNRLRSQRLSRGRLTMQEEQEPRWTISSNKIIIEDPNWSPRFHNLRRTHRRKTRNDENCRINCCGTFNYQSGCNLDSNCLENYRYDHSIYFKTIGDIKSSKRDTSSSCNDENDETSSDERIEWEAKNPVEICNNICSGDDDENDDDEDDNYNEDEFDKFSKENGNVRIRFNDFSLNLSGVEESEDRETHRVVRNVWPIVDLNNLSLDVNTDNNRCADQSRKIDSDYRKVFNDSEIKSDDDNNNNLNENNVDSTENMIKLQIRQLTTNQTRLNSTNESTNNLTSPQRNHAGITRIMNMRKSIRSTRKVRQPAVVGDNNILWPGVLLNYTKNVDKSKLSPHHYRSVQVT